jgi:transcriptional regulator with XRE-family HTH domain
MIIKEKRIAAGLTQEVLARMLGVSQATVAMWETGKSLPRAEMLIKLASVLNCTVDELLTGTPANK